MRHKYQQQQQQTDELKFQKQKRNETHQIKLKMRIVCENRQIKAQSNYKIYQKLDKFWFMVGKCIFIVVVVDAAAVETIHTINDNQNFAKLFFTQTPIQYTYSYIHSYTHTH